MVRSCVGELCMGEADAFEIGEMLAEFFESFIVDGTPAVTDFDEFCEAFELCVSHPGDACSNEVELFEVFEAGELLHA